MLELKKYAAIDIGSNGVRLLISNVIIQKQSEPLFRKSSLVRVPIRLGADTFMYGKISDENIERMTKAMDSYRYIMDIHKVEKFKACATSALREATNGPEIVQDIFIKTGIKIDIIDGKTEAEIISQTDIKELIEDNKSYLYVDVGGGSTEFTLFSKGNLINSKSFKIGTVRLLKNPDEAAEEWEAAKKWVINQTSTIKYLTLIGSGGNINKIFKLSGKAQTKPLSFEYLQNQFEQLSAMSYEERIINLSLNPDRADVIIPALKIYLSSMQWSKATKIYVPKIGLADGIVKMLYYGMI
ncbi:MAG TPA: exopolyphosphatase [Flavobacteriaceae bacterium]|nr:exopolyphosphatase [Flavobacteriaceae bacterium]HEX5742646.1 exopolyphosphatase [Flavobacteriaceae bacterium]